MEEIETPGLDLLQAIFNVWVEMLLCSSYRCSRESHAKHLSNGGRAHNRRVADCGTRWPVPHRQKQQGSSCFDFDQAAAARTYSRNKMSVRPLGLSTPRWTYAFTGYS